MYTLRCHRRNVSGNTRRLAAAVLVLPTKQQQQGQHSSSPYPRSRSITTNGNARAAVSAGTTSTARGATRIAISSSSSSNRYQRCCYYSYYHTTTINFVQHPHYPDQQKQDVSHYYFNRNNNHDNNDTTSMDDLCRKHMDLPTQEFAFGCSFLHQCALGNLEACQQYVKDSPSIINFRDYDRRTPLHVAASEGRYKVCEFLINKGALINRSDRWGGSPLDDCHRHRHTDVVELLYSHGASFGSTSQATNLITAASEGDIEEVQALLEFGCIREIISHGDWDNRTALHLAAAQGRSKIVEILCEAGANVNVRDRWGNRPLDDGINSTNKECVQILKRYKAKRGTDGYYDDGQNNGSGDDEKNHALLDLMSQYGKLRNGELSMDWQDVYDLLIGVGENPTDLCVQKLFQVADMDGDGLITTNEFLLHSDTFLAGRPARIILVVGGPGSGKGLLCERLVKETGVVHLSSGDLLREEVAQGTPLGRQVHQIMKNGGLVSSAILVTLMQKKMKDHPGKRILLDGFPRSEENAKDLVTLCGKPELALHLECDDTVLMERIMKRSLSGNRSDDNFETALQRIRNYHKYHNLTIDFLRNEHIPVVNLDCSAAPDGVWEQLRGIGRLMRSTVRLETTAAQQPKQQGDEGMDTNVSSG